MEISLDVELNAKTDGSPTAVPLDPSKSITQLVLTASRIETWYVPAANELNVALVCHVAPLSIEYSYVPAPPVAAVTAIDPVKVPLHVAAVAVAVAVIASNCVIVTEVVAVQLFPSVTVTV